MSPLRPLDTNILTDSTTMTSKLRKPAPRRQRFFRPMEDFTLLNLLGLCLTAPLSVAALWCAIRYNNLPFLIVGLFCAAISVLLYHDRTADAPSVHDYIKQLVIRIKHRNDLRNRL